MMNDELKFKKPQTYFTHQFYAVIGQGTSIRVATKILYRFFGRALQGSIMDYLVKCLTKLFPQILYKKLTLKFTSIRLSPVLICFTLAITRGLLI